MAWSAFTRAIVWTTHYSTSQQTCQLFVMTRVALTSQTFVLLHVYTFHPAMRTVRVHRHCRGYSSSVFLQRSRHQKVSQPMAGCVTAQHLPSFSSERFHTNQWSVRAQQLCVRPDQQGVTPAAQPRKVSQLLARRTNACHSDFRLFQGHGTYGRRAQNGTSDSLLSQLLFLIFLPDQRLYIFNNMSIYIVYTHI